MSAGNLLSSFKEKPTDGSLNESSKHAGDDDGSGGGCSDPAVLAMGPARRPLTYTRDQLFRIRNSPLVKQGLENAFVGHETLALVLKKRTESPHEDDRGAKGDVPNENHNKQSVFTNARGDRERRSADPRERVRKESEPTGGGIVLSPQRRSFTSGCGAPAASAPPPHVARTRPESPLSAAAAANPNSKSDQGRRVGSGRLMMRDMTTAPWEREDSERDPYRDNFRGNTNREREERTIPRNNDSRFERRSFNRDGFGSDVKRERDDRFISEKRDDNRRSGNNRYSRRFDKEEEPEWFSGGPTSQNDTIELRGFDEPPKRNGNVNSKSEKWSSGSRSPELQSWRESRSPPSDSPDNQNNETQEVESNEKPPPAAEEEENMPALDHADFNFDEFLKLETFPDALTNGVSEGEGGGSRFSRWFQRSETPTQHYERLLHDLVDELDNNCSEPTPSNVFAPISPAGPPPAAHRPPPSLMDLLRRANSNEQHSNQMNSSGGGGGKMHSLEELEACLRPQQPLQMHHQPQSDHDLSAFNRLLAQVSGGHAVPAEPPRPQPPPQQPPMSLLQMLKSMEQQKPQQPHIPQDLLYKLIHVQRQQQELGPTLPAHAAGLSSQDRDLLHRPEAVALLQGLKSGEITLQHLMQQLNNPAVQSRHRDLLHAILRLHHNRHQVVGSPLPSGPPPHLVVPPHHQPLRLSPLPHPAFSVSPIMGTSPNSLTVHHPGVPNRIPSPRELQVHTQSIMQGALIKKKLEEQRENYRRRNEQLAKHTPPISFTPTSVLRKMTADKEEPLSPKQPWNPHTKMPQGRPIVKGNQGGVPSGMGYSPSPSEYQHFLNQQQMAANRPYSLSQQRQQPPPTMNNMNSMSRGAPGATTLHQLLVQSHNRSINAPRTQRPRPPLLEMGLPELENLAYTRHAGQTAWREYDIDYYDNLLTIPQVGISGTGTDGLTCSARHGYEMSGSGGGDNQLARWFSPELLARASAGKLPSVHVPNALSLEDLERNHSPAVRN